MGQALARRAEPRGGRGLLEALCPPISSACAPGQLRYTLLLNDDGGIVDDLMVARPPGADGAPALVVNAARKEVDFALIARARCPRRAADAADDRA